MKTFDFFEQYNESRLGTVKEGILHKKDINDFIDATGSSETIIFDISKMDVFSHSYAKQTIATAYEELIAGRFLNRHFLLKADKKEKLDDSMKAFEKLGSPILTTLANLIEKFYDNYLVVGPIQPNLEETLNLVIERKQITTSEVATHMNISVQNASNRLRTLDEMKLIIRNVDSDRSGNFLSCSRIEL